jgi:hypothetical protein
VDSLTFYITIAPRQHGQRIGSNMMHMATATGLSIMDLHDVCIRIGEFRLVNKCVSPMELVNIICEDFREQVRLESASAFS